MFAAGLLFIYLVPVITEYVEILASPEFCFNAVSLITNSFTAPYDGDIVGIKLVYSSGSVSCNSVVFSHWGCGAMEIGVILVHVTDSNTYAGETYYPTTSTEGFNSQFTTSSCPGGCNLVWYRMNEYNSNSAEIVFMSPIYHVTTDDKFKLEYGEACCQHTTSDNRGASCAKVYFLYSNIKLSLKDISQSLAMISDELREIATNSRTIEYEHDIEDYVNQITEYTDQIKSDLDSLGQNVHSSINPNISQYALWNIDEMLYWLSSLESGRFKKYIITFRNGFISDGIDKGSLLPMITAADLRDKPFEITDFADRKVLSSHFQKLVWRGRQSDGTVLKQEV